MNADQRSRILPHTFAPVLRPFMAEAGNRVLRPFMAEAHYPHPRVPK
ncbi:MAG: hypothetical protein OJF49_001366 [Ktedonobacterales bacterium]|nr:MAG: hypothetical protein OJF49_001366 [Ktedonobacterales bacterium]